MSSGKKGGLPSVRRRSERRKSEKQKNDNDRKPRCRQRCGATWQSPLLPTTPPLLASAYPSSRLSEMEKRREADERVGNPDAVPTAWASGTVDEEAE